MSKQISSVELERQYTELLLEHEKHIAEAVDLHERLLVLGEIELAATADRILKNTENDHGRVRDILETIRFLREIEA